MLHQSHRNQPSDVRVAIKRLAVASQCNLFCHSRFLLSCFAPGYHTVSFFVCDDNLPSVAYHGSSRLPSTFGDFVKATPMYQEPSFAVNKIVV
jgi:hypothetical protein